MLEWSRHKQREEDATRQSRIGTGDMGLIAARKRENPGRGTPWENTSEAQLEGRGPCGKNGRDNGESKDDGIEGLLGAMWHVEAPRI